MFIAGEVDRFLKGELGPVLVVENEGSVPCLSIEVNDDGQATAYIPIAGDPTFDIEGALVHPACATHFRKDEHHIIVDIGRRSQFYAVFKIACNHLGWLDEKTLKKSYRSHLPVERLAS